jgi:uncharacterized protein YecT (DUF1311 family)
MRAIFLGLILSFSATANADQLCLRSANTITEIEKCGTITAKEADKELNRVYQEIRKIYKDDIEFLNALKKSQLAWIKFRDAEYEAMYPGKNKLAAYGTAHTMCAESFLSEITLKRIVELKRWLVGISEGDLCSGSVKSPEEIAAPIHKR